MNLISPKIIAALNRCKLSVWVSVNIIQAADRAFDSLFINKSYINRYRDTVRF